ncbi:MAG: hypothetical protein ABIR30_14315 [Chitinophagaceae bacterium]
MIRNIAFLLLLLHAAIAGFSQVPQYTEEFVCKPTKREHISYKTSWHPYLGLHISGDAEMFYLGPSFQGGVDFQVRERIVLSGYVHYFMKKRENVEYGGFLEKGRFKTFTGALLLQLNTSINPAKSCFLAGGIAIQRWRDKYSTDYDSWDDKRTTWIPAIRVGYFFPIQENKLSIELNGTGPYSYTYGDPPTGRVLEILTQLSLGMRFIF